MPKIIKYLTIFSFTILIFTSIVFYCFHEKLALTLAITFGTIFYHLGIRLLIGFFYNVFMKNKADYTKKWYQIHAWENRFYTFLNVKAWKNKMPTYNPQIFSTKEHTWHEIAQAMCQSELVHETNIIVSFIPIMASKWFGSFSVFLITSICSALFDLLFVIIQRYNRDRVVKIALKRERVKVL